MTAQLASKLVFIDIPATDLAKSQNFYAALFGIDGFAPSPNPKVKSVFHPISADGIDLTLHPKRDQDPPDIPIAFYAVDDLAATIKTLEAQGGKVEHKADIPLPAGKALETLRTDAKRLKLTVGSRLGQAVTMLDPDSNPVGLVQLEPVAAHYFRAGQFQTALRADQVDGLRRALQAEPA